jgi:hypothetical protein
MRAVGLPTSCGLDTIYGTAATGGEGRGLRMLTSYFYSPDGGTIVSKVHAVTSYIQVECHLSLRHNSSLAAHGTPWIHLASTSALVPGEKVHVIFFLPAFCSCFISSVLSFLLSILSFPISCQVRFEGNTNF